MTIRENPAGPMARGGLQVAAPENVLGGAVLIALSALAFYLTWDLPRGTLSSVGPAMLPQAIAVLMAVCGVALVVAGMTVRSEHSQPQVWTLRGPVLVSLSIAFFAATIREQHFSGWNTIEFGLLVAGPVSIVIGGYASPHARFRDLVLLSLVLTPFCMILFGDMLNLPIPILPRAVSDAVFAGWGYKASLRATAAILLVAALAVYWTTRGSKPVVDVAKHDGAL